jgi:hypothetical protein
LLSVRNDVGLLARATTRAVVPVQQSNCRSSLPGQGTPASTLPFRSGSPARHGSAMTQ